MKIIFIAHPLFLGSHSMARFANMLANGMTTRGHQTEIWRPEAVFSKIPAGKFKKWLGYIDQYIVFPLVLKRRMKLEKNNVLYVLTDHALGPYVPLTSDKPHVIHCHDFLAQRSALGEIPENLTSLSGKLYQAYIRNGYRKGNNFISVSEKTRTELKDFLTEQPEVSEMVYNGLSNAFKPRSIDEARIQLGKELKLDLSKGYILHVGGNQWYKNRVGVIEVYAQWRKNYHTPLPLVLIGEFPSAELSGLKDQSEFKEDIYFFSEINDETVRLAYSGASVFLFPSIAEGFGWPIAEAMASGTPVVTTNAVPMTEVAGEAAYLIEPKPITPTLVSQWALKAAFTINEVLSLSENDRKKVLNDGIENSKRFNENSSLDQIEAIYKEIFSKTSRD
jgi:glycosyltransferase involved in cell wall biosynthesis